MNLKLRNGTWYIHFQDSTGARKRISTGTGVEADARLKCLEIMREHMIDALPQGDTRRASINMTLAAALSAAFDLQWRTQRSAKEKRYLIGKIARKVGHWPLPAITFTRLQDLGQELIEGGQKPATANRWMTAIQTAIKLMVKRNEAGITSLPAFPHWAEDNIKERYLTDAEEEAIFSWYKDNTSPADDKGWYMRDLLTTLLDTGMRCGEAVGLGEDNIRRDSAGRLEAVWLRHGTTKNKKGRVVPLTERASPAIERLLDNPLHGIVDVNWVGRHWRTVAGKLGIVGVTVHTFRHTCASRLVQAGVPLQVVKEWLGHSSVVITERYAHLAPDQFNDALTALQNRGSRNQLGPTHA